MAAKKKPARRKAQPRKRVEEAKVEQKTFATPDPARRKGKL